MLRIIRTIIVPGVLCAAAGGAAADVPKGEIRITAKALHPFWRTHPTPVGHEVDVNPPAFIWPSPRIEFTMPLLSYDFELSRTPDFASKEIAVSGRAPSFYIPPSPLTEGPWYWRCRESGKAWNGPYRITIGPNSRLDKRPASADFVKAVTGARPRMVIRKQRLKLVRRELEKSGETDQFIKTASQYFNVELPDKEWGGKFYKNGERVFKVGKFPEGHVKSMVTSSVWHKAITSNCTAYLLTGDDTYAREALRWGLRVATFRLLPENNLDYCGNPYPDSFCCAFYLDCMSYIYDCCYDIMTSEQRKVIRDNLAARLKIYYEYYCNRLENRCIDNHSWQISIGAFVRGAITARGDIPQADTYLAYAYDVWRARDPEQSRTDGGWFGGGYVGVNIGVWTEVPAYFRVYTGHNFYDHPFYHNQPYWFLYRRAPGSQGDGFNGDGYGGGSRGVGWKIGAWMDVLDADLDLPLAGWLADTAEVSRKKRTFAWVRHAEGLPPASSRTAAKPRELPQARAFRDVGVVNMHRDLLNPQNDLHVALRSSPFGTFGHNLASHNAVNVVYKGDYLFVPFGHRHGGARNHAACYRHTRGHNSILVDGKGQPFSPEAYGWIARFLHGRRISYACGDASNAYDAAPFERETKLFAAANLKIDDHISRGVLKRFRRHVLFLRPNLIVVYDELDAETPVRWDWVLHCRRPMTANGSVLTVDGVDATVDVRGSTPMIATVKDKPMFMPINVDGRGKQEQGTPYPVIGCRAFVSSTTKVAKLRLITLMRIGNPNPIEQAGDRITCGDWTIIPEMDPAKLANLSISNHDKSAIFILKTADTGESVLTEVINGTTIVQRTVDVIPYAAKSAAFESGIVK